MAAVQLIEHRLYGDNIVNIFRQLGLCTVLWVLGVTAFANADNEMEYLLDSYAPEPGVLDSWIANYRSIVELGDIPLHLNRSATAEDRAVIRALEDACETQPFTHCQQHIKANRFAIIQSLPSNPAYWAAFWEVFEHESWVNFDLFRGQN